MDKLIKVIDFGVTDVKMRVFVLVTSETNDQNFNDRLESKAATDLKRCFGKKGINDNTINSTCLIKIKKKVEYGKFKQICYNC